MACQKKLSATNAAASLLSLQAQQFAHAAGVRRDSVTGSYQTTVIIETAS